MLIVILGFKLLVIGPVFFVETGLVPEIVLLTETLLYTIYEELLFLF